MTDPGSNPGGGSFLPKGALVVQEGRFRTFGPISIELQWCSTAALQFVALAARVRIPVGALLDRQNGVKVALGVVGPAVQVRSLVPALLLHISRDRGATAARRIPAPKVMGSTPVGFILDMCKQ